MSIQIFFIYADDCLHCNSALLMIETVIAKTQIQCEILKYLFDTPAAINIAANNDITDLPGIVISGKYERYVFMGKNFNEEKITDAIKRVTVK